MIIIIISTQCLFLALTWRWMFYQKLKLMFSIHISLVKYEKNIRSACISSRVRLGQFSSLFISLRYQLRKRFCYQFSYDLSLSIFVITKKLIMRPFLVYVHINKLCRLFFCFNFCSYKKRQKCFDFRDSSFQFILHILLHFFLNSIIWG